MTNKEFTEIMNRINDDGSFGIDQMIEAKYGIDNGLTIEQVLFYYDDRFDSSEMRQAILGFKNGLTKEQVSTYYKKENSPEQMEEKRLEIERMLYEPATTTRRS